ncbi:endonuclease [Kutzneria sp. CA-103260]|uniref:endonuclease n=1 Tax=Kutzneria sp. CA-103260 TaxID=2802641 RepID=UPI001BA63167|nr:endonuclease [Kutzneria sp. CA-103260]QUQ65162.1 endonuclease [Kutzneria sp. CA-103260]
MPPSNVNHLLADFGRTYADEAGIVLRDKPAPLYQLLVLATLQSTRIRADIAAATAKALFAAGLRTPQRMLAATWQQRVQALGQGGYARYDESTATRLGQGAQLLLDNWRGDLRRMRSPHREVQQFPGIASVGADIFCREVQAVWPRLRPFFDQRALDAAQRHGLPVDPKKLAGLVPPDQIVLLATALVRSGLKP